MLVRLLIGFIVGYLLGGVDFAVIVGRMRGVDIYSVGSGNPGTSNVLRTMGRGAAAMVLLGDLAKGLIAAAVGAIISASGVGYASPEAAAALAGVGAVAGHCYPAWHRFKGGKGVATSAGVIIWMNPLVGFGLGMVWGAVVAMTRTASVGSLIVVVLVLPALWFVGVTGWPLAWVAVMMSLVIYRHRPNIKRMLAGGDRKVVTP